MRTRCPCCGAALALDALVAHEAARDALRQAFALDAVLGAALVRYLALHRPRERDLSMPRVASLLQELLPMVQAQRITRAGREYPAPREAWVWAIQQACAARDEGRLVTPLKGHGYLLEVLTRWAAAAPHAEGAPLIEGGASLPAGLPMRASSSTFHGMAALQAFKEGVQS